MHQHKTGSHGLRRRHATAGLSGFGGLGNLAKFAVASIGFMGLVAPAVQAQVAVTEAGQASYAIPVPVPPGMGGLEPKLTLQYARGAAGGPLGAGWTLGGLSAVTRCGTTVAADGVRRGVKFTAEDRFCLDGQRLVLTNAAGVPVAGQGGYGNPGTEYRTEKESHSRIRAYGGSAATGPGYFRVWTKSGLVYDYGMVSSGDTGRIPVAMGYATAMSWAVVRVADRHGNYMAMDYSVQGNSFAGGSGVEWRIGSIRYTGNGTQPPQTRVSFDYEARPDGSEAWHEGSKTVNTSRIAAIRTFSSTADDGSGGTPVNVL